MEPPFSQVDVFTEEPPGATLRLVVDAEGLSTEEMQRFARWTNLSETTFVLPPQAAGADYRCGSCPSRELPSPASYAGDLPRLAVPRRHPAPRPRRSEDCEPGLIQCGATPARAGLAGVTAPPLLRLARSTRRPWTTWSRCARPGASGVVDASRWTMARLGRGAAGQRRRGPGRAPGLSDLDIGVVGPIHPDPGSVPGIGPSLGPGRLRRGPGDRKPERVPGWLAPGLRPRQRSLRSKPGHVMGLPAGDISRDDGAHLGRRRHDRLLARHGRPVTQRRRSPGLAFPGPAAKATAYGGRWTRSAIRCPRIRPSGKSDRRRAGSAMMTRLRASRPPGPTGLPPHQRPARPVPPPVRVGFHVLVASYPLPSETSPAARSVARSRKRRNQAPSRSGQPPGVECAVRGTRAGRPIAVVVLSRSSSDCCQSASPASGRYCTSGRRAAAREPRW